MMSRMTMTHDMRGITVISGPWGIGKTTTIDQFAHDIGHECAVVKVEPGTNGRGAVIGRVLQCTVEALRKLNGKFRGTQLSNSTWTLRQMVRSELIDLFHFHCVHPDDWKFTFIFDEAQYLSKDAIDTLRFWNDGDRPSTPIPVGLIFVGNNEFALAEDATGESVLSGAVRSRLLFEVPLAYSHVSTADLTLFAQSRGIVDADALDEFVSYFSNPRVKPDLRRVERSLGQCRRHAGDGPISQAVVREILTEV